MTRVVTLSAAYGAGGQIVGHAVASELGVPFLDRAIPVAVARKLAVSVDDADAHDEASESRVGRILSGLAAAGIGLGPIPQRELSAEAYRQRTEEVMTAAAATTGCVVLGRAGAIVLRDLPGALHVALTGSQQRRIAQARHLAPDQDPAELRRLIEVSDRNRSGYFRHFYNADPNDLTLYQLVIDATLIDFDTCASIIVSAARVIAA
jgi:cytidylate kinase